MPKIAYINKRFREASLAKIDQANEIIEDYAAQGFTLTLRQLFYQFVSRGIIPNTERSYKNFGALITDARNCGLIDWLAIEDRGRNHLPPYINPDADTVLAGISNRVAVDVWYDQDTYLEIWVEKDALSSIIEDSCRPFRVTSLACRGYLSSSEIWRAAERFIAAADRDKRCVLVHLGDHDPSGLDMSRDNEVRSAFYHADVDLHRLALNMDQIEQYAPPPNPTKVTDSRAGSYIKRFGRESWELDALEPAVLRDLIQGEIRCYIDPDAWNQAVDREQVERSTLVALEGRWHDVKAFLEAGT